MKIHFKLASLIFFFASLVAAEKNEIKLFFLLLSFSLEIYSLTQLEIDWEAKIDIKNLKKFTMERFSMSWSGKICEFAALICLVGFFISP